ncbi:uncharacterized protein LOC111597233 [Drosophila hydei]|uniref:Uncharacterized protein LOC111597233 n=1 Tax=Drosophila hydei TaxID=7224 RepID=A0A6J1LRC7_DROHY|nr:uncharacterized protein LOC111597233 [Drosophila hydei]
MCSSTESTIKSRFHIELLADRSVVLVNARGHESEIFLPDLQNGRVCLRNVIFSRQPKPEASEMNFLSCSPIKRCHRMGSHKLTTATAGLAPNTARTDISKRRFELKLISNGKVVLVECNGCESEIFLPHICSRCVAMKRISAYELAQCASLKSGKTTKSVKNSAASIAASLATQAIGLSNLLINPCNSVNTDKQKSGQRPQKEKQLTKTKKLQQKSQKNAASSIHKKPETCQINLLKSPFRTQ